MGWKGMLVGSCVGSYFGGIFGSLLGAFLGHRLEDRLFGSVQAKSTPSSAYRDLSANARVRIFCATTAAMLAKMAKADGRVTRDEIAGVERAFARLGFTAEARSYAIDVFRRAKDDARTIYAYAREFAAAVDSVEVRELLYELLWEIACADGAVGDAERVILQQIPAALNIRPAWYAFFANRRFGSQGRAADEPRDELAAAYAVLNARPADSADVLRRKYRELAKKNHPDALRAQGLPDELVGKATERMGRINAAWAAVRAARGI